MTTWTGIFTPQDAAALLHERPEAVRRWAFGYTRKRQGRTVHHPPLIKHELPSMEGEPALTFVEVVEMLYIRAFQRAGASWSLIREAACVAARLYDSDHPFALRQVYVDPHSVYAALREADGSESLVQLSGHGQQAFPALVKPYLDQIDFDVNQVASRWWPLGRLAGVMVDPRHAFGAPVLENSGIRTEVLRAAFVAEGGASREVAVDRVAWMYEIAPRDVDLALRFEQWLKAA
jgi:uncharacterized protein (DUF433 family)